jgi:HEAT repeat protein
MKRMNEAVNGRLNIIGNIASILGCIISIVGLAYVLVDLPTFDIILRLIPLIAILVAVFFLLKKSEKPYVKSIIIIFLLLSAILFFGDYMFLDREKVADYRSVLKYRKMEALHFIDKELLELSKESLRLKKKVLSEILTDEENIYEKESLETFYHSLIGTKASDRKELLDFSLSKYTPQNADKLKILFSKKFIIPSERQEFQTKLFEKIGKSENSSDLEFLAEALGEIDGKGAIPYLKELLKKEYTIALKAVISLGKLSQPGVVQSLIEILNESKTPEYRTKAAEALGEKGKKGGDSIDALKGILENEKIEIDLRGSAATALGYVCKNNPDSSIVTALTIVVGDSKTKEDLKLKVIEALALICKEKPNSAVVMALKNVFREARIRKNNYSTILRKNAIVALGEIAPNDPKSSSQTEVELIKVFNEKKNDISLRKIAAITLGKICGSNYKLKHSTINALIKVLNKPGNDEKHRALRMSAAESLGYMSDTGKLKNGLKFKDTYVRDKVAEVLGRIGSKKAIEALIGLANSKNSGVPERLSAIKGLGFVKKEALKNEDLKKEVKRILIDGMEDSDEDVILASVNATKNVYFPESVVPLARLIDFPGPTLEDYSKSTPSSAFDALIKIGDDNAIRQLIMLLCHPDRKIKENSAKALGKIGASAQESLHREALHRLYDLCREEKDIKRKFSYLQAILRLNPSDEEYLGIMVKNILTHPLSIVYELKPEIIKTIEEISPKIMHGEQVDFENNIWSVLEWYQKLKEE